MKSYNVLLPKLNDGRLFVSPILGCRGSCAYCYLCLHDYNKPHKNEITIKDIMQTVKKLPNFVYGEKGTIISIGAWGTYFL